MHTCITTGQSYEEEESCESNRDVIITYGSDQVQVKQIKPERHNENYLRVPSRYQDKYRSNNNINTFNNLEHEQVDNTSHFYRVSISQPVKTRSVLKKKMEELREMKIKVEYFGTERFREFTAEQLDLEMKVSNFIDLAIEHYCNYYLSFVPSNIESGTFQLRIDNTQPIEGMILNPIGYEDSIHEFMNAKLYLTRKRFPSDIMEKLQSKIGPDSDIFEVDIPYRKVQKRNQKFMIVKKPGNTLQVLMNKLYKTCDITQSPAENVLIEYYRFKVYDRTQLLENIKERKFQLLRMKRKIYQDAIMTIGPVDTETEQHRDDNWIVKNIYTNEPIKKELAVEINYGFMKGKMQFSIQNCQFVESYQRTVYSKLAEGLTAYPYQVKYSLLALNHAYEHRQNLILEFLTKKGRITKKYPMGQMHRKSFLEQILRLCRIYKKNLRNKNTE